MSRDTTRQQLYEACRNRTAVLIVEYFLALREQKDKKFPKEKSDSPRLWIDFSQAALADHFMVSRSTVQRAIARLQKIGLCQVHQQGYDRTSMFELHMPAIHAVLQVLPMVESVAGHGVMVNQSMASPCINAWRHGESIDGVMVTPCINLPPSFIPSTIIREPADAEIVQQPETENQEAAQAVLPAVPEPGLESTGEAPDADREAIIDDMRALNISQEFAEAYLTDHSRQKIRAALKFVAGLQARGRIRETGSGLFIRFLENPARYSHELDRQGCWRPAAEIVREKKRHAVKARDRPQRSPAEQHRLDCESAWQHCDGSARSQILHTIEQAYPDEPRARQLQRCREIALQRREHTT